MIWIGAVFCALIFMAWFWSTQNSALYMRDDWKIHLHGGLLRFEQSALITAAIANATMQLAINNQPILQRQSVVDLIKNGPKPPPMPPTPIKSIWSVWSISSESYGFQWWEFGWESYRRHLVLPLWMAFSGFGFVTAFSWGARRWWRRRGHCIECGYCLTGNESGICPECGAKTGTNVKIIPIVVEPILIPGQSDK